MEPIFLSENLPIRKKIYETGKTKVYYLGKRLNNFDFLSNFWKNILEASLNYH